MRISRDKVIELIDEKIQTFEKLLAEAAYNNRYGEDYNLVYHGTQALLTELFSPSEGMIFATSVTTWDSGLEGYKRHINRCVTQLKVYRERIQNFWPTDEIETLTKAKLIPFVSMSFDESDKYINQYVTGLLDALQIEFETGERYSKESIPQKVQGRIRSSDLFVAIFVKRDKIEGGGYTTPSWLLKELGIAQGAGKDVIALVERGIKDIAGLDYEKEVIYFERDDPTAIEKATIKLLEALKEHGLV